MSEPMNEPRRLETWMNASKGRIGVLKFDRYGQLVSETIRSGAKFQITTEERFMNSERAATPALDVFNCGYLVPVKILDGTEDAKDIASNPNLLSESHLKKLFRGTAKAFNETVGGITNVSTLRHMLDMADEDDVDAKQSFIKILKNRLITLEPDLAANEIETINGDDPIRGMNPVSPN